MLGGGGVQKLGAPFSGVPMKDDDTWESILVAAFVRLSNSEQGAYSALNPSILKPSVLSETSAV